ncbi:MAG: hypothetical protein V4819_19060 [Verrucomicrobiota bacterium]
MKKSRAIFFLIALVVVIGGYVAWAAWDPTPTVQTMKFDSGVGAVGRSAAEADCRKFPPKARKLGWGSLVNRLTYPYQSREDPSIRVREWNNHRGDGEPHFLVIVYPREEVHLHESWKDGSWFRKHIYKR